MVGRTEEDAMYMMSVTSAGQVTIPKDLRDSLGITTTVMIRKRGDKLTLERTKTLRERMAEVRAGFSAEEKKAIRKNAGKTVNELRAEMEKTLEGQEYARSIYGA